MAIGEDCSVTTIKSCTEVYDTIVTMPSLKLSTFRGAYGVTLVLGSNNWALLKHIVSIFL